MISRESFNLIRDKHGAYASWAIWAEAGAKAKSNMGVAVLDPDKNPCLLGQLRPDVVMLGLNLARSQPSTFGDFHPEGSTGNDYKIRYAFTGTPYYGAYMTDVVNGVICLKAADLMRHLAANPDVITGSVKLLLEEFADLNSGPPTIIAFGKNAHSLVVRNLSPGSYTRLACVTHYSVRMSQVNYRTLVRGELAAQLR